MKYFSILFCSLFLPSLVYAVPDIKVTPGYEVEVLVFKNLKVSEQESELWSQDTAPLGQADLENSITVGGGIPVNSEIRKAFEKMLESGQYTLVAHKRWIQDALPKTEAQLIRIANAETRLDGTVRFYKNRYLHLDVNLVLGEEFIPESGDAGSRENAQNYFIIKEQKRIRSKNLNYFDHPRFGVLIKVHKIKVSRH